MHSKCLVHCHVFFATQRPAWTVQEGLISTWVGLEHSMLCIMSLLWNMSTVSWWRMDKRRDRKPEGVIFHVSCSLPSSFVNWNVLFNSRPPLLLWQLMVSAKLVFLGEHKQSFHFPWRRFSESQLTASLPCLVFQTALKDSVTECQNKQRTV